MFGLSEKFLLETESKQGQVFIRPTTDKPFSITLITEKGVTQDLLLTLKKRSAETIILKLPNNKKESKWETDKRYTQTLRNL